MASNRNIVYFFRNLGKKHRLSLHDQRNEAEVWYMYLSPLRLIAVAVAVLLILFIVILTLVAYTPILNMIPGYSGNQQREQMIQNILRVDSIEQRLNDIEAWGYDVSLIMEGKTPFVRDVTQAGDTIHVTKPEPVFRSEQDSVLRSQMEGTGIYGLRTSAARRGQGELQSPVRGVVAAHFSPGDASYAVGFATANSQQVMAVAEGTVVFTTWSPDDGWLVQIQHADNLISIYKHLSQSLLAPNTRVRKGEVIGFTGDGLSGEGGKGLFELELWQNGVPLDPENYIVL
ncbi:M23 family metallopeptidase [Alistipes sp. OttesenSCG-928-B03]|nr:M23 family metallopeptidase [Alistipes sp. OttesenSCG-928-B03]